ncbi:MAG: metal-sensitive transcriptional regulator [Actinomycetota bacterium]|jgi:DNA-binding FrmR family transcriptional regulator|nr:metal-sensitive transcriptional regulator [Actinomycetota bacterium]
MQVEESVVKEITTRLRRVQGQVGGIIAMIEDGRNCSDIVTQLAAAEKALSRAGFKIVASGLQQCQESELRGETPQMTRDQLEKLFLSLS